MSGLLRRRGSSVSGASERASDSHSIDLISRIPGPLHVIFTPSSDFSGEVNYILQTDFD